jgi:hypothetical protein
MFNVTLTMTREELEATLKASKEAEKVAVEWLDQIRANIRTLETAVFPIKSQRILSATYPDTSYRVTRENVGPGYVYTCECNSFRYVRGLDQNGHCKHIRNAIARYGAWA